MSEYVNPPEPREGARARATGDHLTPEGAKARFTGVRRGAYPKDGLTVDGIPPAHSTKGGPSGSHTENTMKSNLVQPVATRPTPIANTSNPLK